jgi:hypothetical protein
VRFAYQRPDLDTCLAGTILGFDEMSAAVFRPLGALADELADPGFICLEAGGSGQTELNNYDHHATRLPLAPACAQAFAARGRPARYRRLVEFTEIVDQWHRSDMMPGFPNVSHLISGIRFVHFADPERQLRAGISALRRIAESGLDPFASLPWLPEWAEYLEEKTRRVEVLHTLPREVELVRRGRLVFGFLRSAVPGAVGAVYAAGADVAVVSNPAATGPAACKYTIAANQIRIDPLLPVLNSRESGWGGPSHGTIVGSPRAGSHLPFCVVRNIVLENASLLRGRS